MVVLLYDNERQKLTKVDKSTVLPMMYTFKLTLPTEKQVVGDVLKDDEIFKDGIKEGIRRIQLEISKIDDMIPLYDEYTKNMLLIAKENVYNRVIYQNYRFPNEMMIEKFNKQLKKEQNLKIKYEHVTDKELHERKKHKLKLMIAYLKQFHVPTLKNTYIKVFYCYSDQGKNITICLRPSFLPHLTHIRPYYDRDELINMALNMDKIKPSNIYYDQERLAKLCKIVKKNDISAEVIINHLDYMIKENKIGIVQFYSLQGSYFMNEYLRGNMFGDYQNEKLEESIVSMWQLVNGAPAFDKSYTLYRFVKDDKYLDGLKVGDEFVSQGFVSTTRDPFYKSDVYQFGFILIKIKIPGNLEGVALCIETVSNFKMEEEIILSPQSVLRLDRKDTDVPYYHIDKEHNQKIKTRYEFTYIAKKEINLVKKKYKPKIETINFLSLGRISTYTMDERVKYFTRRHLNEIYQFNTVIGGMTYTMMTETYNSMDVYSNFYAVDTQNGFMIYNIIDDNLGLTIEISDEKILYVNYYFRVSSTPNKNKIKDEDLLNFVAQVGFHFNLPIAIIFCEYVSCEFKDTSKKYKGGNYPVDFYNYFKYGTLRYKAIKEVKPGFSTKDLDRLKEVDPKKLLNRNDRDEIYQIYDESYKKRADTNSLSDFYIWMIENHCVLIPTLVKKIDRVFKDGNPFRDDHFVFNISDYLKNRGMIKEGEMEGVQSIDGSDFPPKNKYRLLDNRRSAKIVPSDKQR